MSLRDQIQKLRRTSYGTSKFFVPHRTLFELLTGDVILNAVQAGRFTPSYNVESVANRITSGARRIFAILIVLRGQEKEILCFLENDQFQSSPLDHRLPFSKADLERFVPALADEFFEKQWEFAAPVFTRGVGHRSLDVFTVLPFTEDQKIGEGGFGEVFKVTLDADHQDLSLMVPQGRGSRDKDQSPSQSLTFVRKQFLEILDKSNSDHELELCNLSLLNQLKHPNIVELLSFYTYQRKRNFIFPLAKDGDLESLFMKDTRPAKFQDDACFYCALCGLSSGIEKIHNYTTEKGIQLVGLHQDLKPSNILVNDGHFVVADFGLSKLKSQQQGSKTPFRIGGGDYLAPECEDLAKGFVKGIMNRSSDIWSFGCIIAEVICYMSQGASGVIHFRDARKFQPAVGWTMRTFYVANGKVNPSVLNWVADLEESHTPRRQQLCDLVLSMLSPTRDDRPTAQAVTWQLRIICINELIASVYEKYKMVMTVLEFRSTSGLQGFFELERFKSWESVWTTELSPHPDLSANSTIDLAQYIEALQAINNELVDILRRSNTANNPDFLQLRQLNDELISLLPGMLQQTVHTRFELQLLDSNYEPSRDFDSLAEDYGAKIRFMKFMKDMSDQANSRATNLEQYRIEDRMPSLNIRSEGIDIKETFGYHSQASRKQRSTQSEQQVLVEWIVYDMHWEGAIREEMLTRIDNIAQFLNKSTANAQQFGLLRCSGYLHSIPRHAFGLVFDFPKNVNCAPRSLAAIIPETGGKPDPPHLGDRFALAASLVSIVLDLHKATIVHKSISSFNVAFFPTGNDSLLKNPFLIGFNHARPDDPQIFSEGPSRNSEARRYFAPGYEVSKRFRLEFDYYSLGLVLLEIGLWDTIISLDRSWKASSAQDLRDKLVQRRVPLLGHLMGTKYRNVVLACLRGEFHKGKPVKEQPSNELILEFERLVAEPLRQLVA